MKVTQNYGFPLQWDQYESDRDLLDEALARIDVAIKTAEAGEASQIVYDGFEADPDETVSEALDSLFIRTNTFEIAINATGGADTGEVLWVYDVTRPFSLPATLTGSRGSVLPISSLDMSIRIDKNSTPIGSIDIAANVLSFNFPDPETFVAGDQIVFVSNDTTTFRSVSASLLADHID